MQGKRYTSFRGAVSDFAEKRDEKIEAKKFKKIKNFMIRGT